MWLGIKIDIFFYQRWNIKRHPSLEKISLGNKNNYYTINKL